MAWLGANRWPLSLLRRAAGDPFGEIGVAVELGRMANGDPVIYLPSGTAESDALAAQRWLEDWARLRAENSA